MDEMPPYTRGRNDDGCGPHNVAASAPAVWLQEEGRVVALEMPWAAAQGPRSLWPYTTCTFELSADDALDLAYSILNQAGPPPERPGKTRLEAAVEELQAEAIVQAHAVRMLCDRLDALEEIDR